MYVGSECAGQTLQLALLVQCMGQCQPGEANHASGSRAHDLRSYHKPGGDVPKNPLAQFAKQSSPRPSLIAIGPGTHPTLLSLIHSLSFSCFHGPNPRCSTHVTLLLPFPFPFPVLSISSQHKPATPTLNISHDFNLKHPHPHITAHHNTFC